MKLRRENVTRRNAAFTIVELLIVIVVIAILAAVTIVAFSGIQDRARQSSVKGDVSAAIKSIEAYKITSSNSEQYPATLGAITNLRASGDNTYAYYPNSTANTYCIESSNDDILYSATNFDPAPVTAPCSQNGISGWWQLNNSIVDSSTFIQNGTSLNGGTSVTGQNGLTNGAYSFAGTSNQGILLPTPGQYNTVGDKPFTLSAWMRTTDTNGQRCIFSTASSGNGIRFGHSGGNPYYLIGGTAGHQERSLTGAGGSLRDGNWHLLTMSFHRTGTGWSIDVYIDGALLVTDTNTVQSIGAGSFANIGSMNGATNGLYNGTIDDIRLFKRALTAAEVADLYARGAV